MQEQDILEKFIPTNWVNSEEMIKVIGVGGGGCNAVDYMYKQGLKGCSFIVCNTDSQALKTSSIPNRIQMGKEGLGAGTNPTMGRNAAIESQEEIERQIADENTKMLFITAGMGGGTGTGASPVIANIAKSKGILTVAVVTLPFRNEGNEAMTRAVEGIRELEKCVDSLLLINNEKLHEFYGNRLIQQAFPKTNEVLATAVRGIIEIIQKPGYINVDFNDVQTMMRDSGMALMGIGEGNGENRIENAVKSAFESPLLNDFDLKSAKNVLINITCGYNEKGLTMDDLNEINQKINEYTGKANKFKRGMMWDDDPEIGDTIRITSIVTGLLFRDVIGPEKDMGNYIIIDKNFVYDKGEVSRNEGIPLYEAPTIQQKSGGISQKIGGTYIYYPNQKPCLAVSPGDNTAELEETTAIERQIARAVV